MEIGSCLGKSSRTERKYNVFTYNIDGSIIYRNKRKFYIVVLSYSDMNLYYFSHSPS